MNRKNATAILAEQEVEDQLKAYRVMLVDDHTIVRLGLRSIIESQPGMKVVAEVGLGEDAIAEAQAIKPDLVVLDLSLPDINGIQVLEAIRKDFPEIQVLVLTMHFDEDLAREVLKLGAIGYVLKSDADTDLLAAVDHARHHQPFFTHRLAITMADNFISPRVPSPEESGEIPLTAREMQVVQLLSLGKSNKETAAELKVSTRTIESHRHHIMRKMRFTNFTELVRFAIRQNLVDL